MKVFELTELIKQKLERDFSEIEVEGEISNFRPSSAGHIYFSLKDDKAVLSSVLFRGQAARLSFRPKDGQKVLARGRISVYPPRGNYQMICTSLSQAGEGDLLKILEERKQRLAQEGLFDSELKKPLPLFPRRIALVTSPTGAALRDMLQVLERRHSRADIVVMPCTVQGEGSEFKISQQIDRVNRYNLADVIIVSRGGGSIEDLLPFSEECVVRSIYHSQIPVVSGVGHEIDFALSDFASDYRAPTPSAAAEVVSAHGRELLDKIEVYKSSLQREMEQRMDRIRLLIAPFSTDELERSIYSYLEPLLMQLDDEREDLIIAMQRRLEEKRHTLELIKQDLEGSSPLSLLERGFARVSDGQGKTIMDSSQLAAGQDVEIRFFKGKAKAEIREIMNENL